MKRISSNVERTGDNIKIKGLFRSKWKKPAKISVVTEELEMATESTVIEGDAKEVFSAVSSVAEIAWEMGWRPAGLVPMLSHVINNFKLPKDV